MRERPKSASEMHVAVVGTGRFGRAHLERYVQRDDCVVVGVASSDESHARAAVAEFGIADAATSLDSILARGVDAVSVVSTSATHFPIARELLAHGVPVLLEKPVALTATDGFRLLDAERQSGAFVLPGHILRFSAPYRQLRQRLRTGEIGRMLSVNFTKHRTLDHDVRYPGEHPVMLTGIHDIDLALWLTGEDLVVVRSTETIAESRNQPVAIVSELRTSSGIHVHLTNTWSLAEGDEVADRLEVVGTEGLLRLELNPRVRSGTSAVDEDIAPPGGGGALSSEIEHFLACVRTGESSPVITLDEAVRGLVAAEAVIAAGAADRVVEIEDDPR